MDTAAIALQLYTVRAEMARDPRETLRHVAEIGYTAVEGGGADSPGEMPALLPALGLRQVGAMVRLDALETDLDRQIDYCRAVGCRYLVLSWLEPDWRSGAALCVLAPRLDAVGSRCRERGIRFAYHNHDFEFAQHEGAYMLDILLGATDPALVALEFDIYWAAYAGVDPLEVLRAYPGRVPLVHLKDMAADRSFADLGEGTLDLPTICAAARPAGADWFIVENDEPRAPALDSARRSWAYLRDLLPGCGVPAAPGAVE